MLFRKSEIIKALRQANDDICNFNDKLEKENFVLKKIILDALSESDLCILCKNKGQVLPECNIKENKDCLRHIVELYDKEIDGLFDWGKLLK